MTNPRPSFRLHPVHRQRIHRPPLVLLPDIYPRDDGMFRLGLDDETAAGPFWSRNHAAAVAADAARRGVSA
jgi:hypothetical protein